MALWIRDTSVVPDKGWRYPHVASGQFIVYPYQSLYYEIVRVYTSNNVTPPSWDEVVAWMCEHLSVPCVSGNVPLINRFTQGLPSLPLPAGCCSKQAAPVQKESVP